MLDLLQLRAADFNALAAGKGDAETIAILRTGQYSKRLLLLNSLIETALSDHADEATKANLQSARDLMAQVEDQSPEVFGDAILEPQFGEWLRLCLQRMAGVATSRTPLWLDLAFLGNVAAAAAITAGISTNINISLRDNTVMLPGWGVAAFDHPDDDYVTLSHDGSATRIVSAHESVIIEQDGMRTDDAWQNLRVLRLQASGKTFELALDDIHPFRTVRHANASPRLSEKEVANWHLVLQQSWECLVTDHPERAMAIREGIRSIIPLRQENERTGSNATSMDAFGSLGMTLVSQHPWTALGLVHEFQHAKLGALIDLIKLTAASPDERFYAPWRGDPRPLEGLLQGTYAYLGVVEFWNIEQQNPQSHSREMAQLEFARWREQVQRAIEVLLDTNRLTDEGTLFVQQMAKELERSFETHIPADIALLAKDAAVDHETIWKLRNLEPDALVLQSLAEAWQENDYRSRPFPPSRVLINDRVLEISPRQDLLILAMADPVAFEAQCSTTETSIEQEGRYADISYVRGDHASALIAYQQMIEKDTDDIYAWAGFVLAAQYTLEEKTITALKEHPEVVKALYKQLRLQSTTHDLTPHRVAQSISAKSLNN